MRRIVNKLTMNRKSCKWVFLVFFAKTATSITTSLNTHNVPIHSVDWQIAPIVRYTMRSMRIEDAGLSAVAFVQCEGAFGRLKAVHTRCFSPPHHFVARGEKTFSFTSFFSQFPTVNSQLACVCVGVDSNAFSSSSQTSWIDKNLILVMRQESLACVYLSSAILSYSIARRLQSPVMRRTGWSAICICQFASISARLNCFHCSACRVNRGSRSSIRLGILVRTQWLQLIGLSLWDCEIRLLDCFIWITELLLRLWTASNSRLFNLHLCSSASRTQALPASRGYQHR